MQFNRMLINKRQLKEQVSTGQDVSDTLPENSTQIVIRNAPKTDRGRNNTDMINSNEGQSINESAHTQDTDNDDCSLEY